MNAIFQKAKERYKIEDNDAETIKSTIKHCLEENWQEADILQYLSYTEEINPTLPEKVALSRMNKIANKYKCRN